KIAIIFGTRPEIVKLYPVIKSLKPHFEVVIVFTGQHTDLGRQMLKMFKIKPDYDLDVMIADQSLSLLTASLHEELDKVLEKEKPDLVMVQGDTTSALVGAIEAFYHKIPVAHVEAGLRTNDMYSPYPEEINRRLISQIATYNFPPTKNAEERLKQEVPGSYILTTGNTGIDTLLEFAKKSKESKRWMVLVTLHRRESFGPTLKGMLYALYDFIKEFPKFEIVFPVHPNPQVYKTVHDILGNHPRIHLIKPVDYLEMIKLMKQCYFIITDSGGIQEEAPSLKKPVLVLREVTERMEGIEAGVSRLVGTNSHDIYHSACELVSNPLSYSLMQGKNPYGDGKASERIAEYLQQALA
ncbi:MAG: UDP-N-acetylglucosamine 2-epimerase (non-hydrolyzing), partial [Patescibacteria group bacterium]